MDPEIKDYSKLQTSVDRVIGKIGLEKTVFLLDSFIDNVAVCPGNNTKIKLLANYLVGTACEVFALDQAKFSQSQTREYRDARMCCFHLLRKYTQEQYSRIGEEFHTKERIAMYGSNVTAARLDYPKGHPVFTKNYNAMESRFIIFLSKLN